MRCAHTLVCGLTAGALAAFVSAYATRAFADSPGSAQTPSAEPQASPMPSATPTATTASGDAPSFRRDIGVGLVAATSSRHGLFGGEAYWLAGGVTFHLDLGAQVSPEVAVYFRGEVGSLVLSGAVASYAVIEWKPHPRWSLGTGFGAEAYATWYGGSWAGLSVPVIVGFDIVHRDHGALRLEYEQTGGYDEQGTAGWHSALTLKWIWN